MSAQWTQQLGIEPSQPLQQLHQRLLTDDDAEPASVSAVSRPLQLPSVAPGLVGRAAELARLTELLERSAAATMLATVTGPGGIGKTTLVLHWAQAMADRFPDGQIYVDLRGFDANGVPMAPSTAIRILLDALDVPPQRIPSDVDAQAALLRRRLVGKRTLMVLDNARDAEQVRPLLPGTAGGAVIVTSRNQLAGLSASHGACVTTIGVLSNVEARELLAARVGDDRVDAEPTAVEEIVARCGNLPLALAIVAARAAGARHRHPIGNRVRPGRVVASGRFAHHRFRNRSAQCLLVVLCGCERTRRPPVPVARLAPTGSSTGTTIRSRSPPPSPVR
jgi:hypothetical protein